LPIWVAGEQKVNQYFKENHRFEFHNFDHHSDNDLVISRDIKHIPLDDLSILPYYRRQCGEAIAKNTYKKHIAFLDTGYTLLIVEPFKRWNKELDDEDKPVNKFGKLLEENNFTIIQNEERKFMFIECRK